MKTAMEITRDILNSMQRKKANFGISIAPYDPTSCMLSLGSHKVAMSAYGGVVSLRVTRERLLEFRAEIDELLEAITPKSYIKMEMLGWDPIATLQSNGVDTEGLSVEDARKLCYERGFVKKGEPT